MLSGALASLLQLEEDLEVVAQVHDGQAAWEGILKEEPDVCILDIEMPKMTGLEVARKIREANLPCKIMIVTTFSRPGYLQQAMEIKVDAYLLKDEPIDFLVSGIRKVMKGEQVISSDLATMLFMRETNPLTERERQVLQLVREGMSTRQIAKTLYLTNGTVRNYLSSAIQKLEVTTRHAAIQKAVDKGWL